MGSPPMLANILDQLNNRRDAVNATNGFTLFGGKGDAKSADVGVPVGRSVTQHHHEPVSG